jgi:hypothetical protein
MTRKINFLVLLCSFVFFLHIPAFGQTTLSKTISLSKLFTSADFKGAPTVAKTTDGFTIILEKASWDATRNAVKISSGGAITINSQQRTGTQKGYLFNKIVFDKLGTFNQTLLDSIIPNRGTLTANADNPEEVTWTMDNGDIAVPGYNHTLRFTTKGEPLYLDDKAGSMTVSYIETDSVIPYIRLSDSYFEQSILQKSFKQNPTYAIFADPEMKENITSQFSVNFYFGRAKDLTNNTVTTTDAGTGSTVSKLYGRVTIGDKPGDAYVMIRATPYSDTLFTTVYGAYLIHIPQIKPQVALSQDTIKAYLGTEIALPTATITDVRGSDITDKYDIGITAKTTTDSDKPEGTLFSYTNDKHKVISLKKEGSFAFHYTFTPKNTTQYAGYERDVPVTIIKATGGSIPTTVSFAHEEHTIKLTNQQVKLDTAIVRDNLGNDVTSCFKIDMSINSDPKHVCKSFWSSSHDADSWLMQTEGNAEGTVVFDVIAKPDGSWGHDFTNVFSGSTTTLTYSSSSRYARLIVSPNNFTTYINGYINEDNQPTLHNDYNGQEVEGTYWVKVPSAVEPSAQRYDTTFAPDSTVVDASGTEWVYYNYNNLKNNGAPSNWRLSFGKAVTSTDIVFIFHPWNQGQYGDVSAPMHLTVLDKITPTLTFSQDSCVANVGKYFEEPTLTITDPNGTDISSHFTLSYSIDLHDGSKATIDANTGKVNIGDDQSYAFITVEATPATDDDKTKYNSGKATYRLRIWKQDDATWAYSIKEGEDKYAYNYDKREGSVSVTATDAGMLSFTKAGKMQAGTSIAGVPGLTVTFGKEGGRNFTVSADDDSAFYCVAKEVNFSGNSNIPSDGTFYMLQPKVNGFVTVKARYLSGNKVVVRWDKGNGSYEDDSYTATSDGIDSHRFSFPLFAGYTYYLFNIGNGASNKGLQLYGINYQPAWLMTRYDTEGYKRTKIYIGAYTGHLPKVVSKKTKGVTFTTEYDSLTQEQKAQKPNYVTVDNTGRIGLNTGIDKNAIINHPLVNNPGIGVLASVKSAETNAVKHAIIAVKLSGLPVYIVRNGETPIVGEKVTTTPKTNITMTYGGWSNYYLANPTKGTYALDSWKVAKMDSTGTNNRIYAGFPDYTGGGQNAKHENVYRNTGNYMPSAPSTWDVPCRGAYLKFEPMSNGRLNVYVLQNGCCQYSGNPDDIEPNGDGTYTAKVKWTPFYLIDETGKPVDFTAENSVSANAINTEDEANYALGVNTKGIYRVNYEEKIGSQTVQWDFSDMGPEAKGNPTLTAQRKAYIIDKWKSHKKGEDEEVINTDDGSHLIISKAYVRYTFDVQAGKTYFLFSNVSKIGLCGFSYVEYDHLSTQTVELPEAGDATPTTYKGTFVSVHVPNNYTRGKWSSICLPFSMNEGQFKRTFGSRAHVIAFDDIRNDSVLFTRHYYQFIVAGRPYFIYPDKTISSGFTVDTVYMGKQAAPSDYYLTAPGDNDYTVKGLFATTLLNQGSLVVVGSNGTQDGGGKMYAIGSVPANLSAYHAYIDFTGTVSSSPAKAFYSSFDGKEHGRIGGEGTTTSIEGVTELDVDSNRKAAASARDNRVYNLSGQCVGNGPDALSRLPQGIYIINGMKVVRR